MVKFAGGSMIAKLKNWMLKSFLTFLDFGLLVLDPHSNSFSIQLTIPILRLRALNLHYGEGEYGTT